MVVKTELFTWRPFIWDWTEAVVFAPTAVPINPLIPTLVPEPIPGDWIKPGINSAISSVSVICASTISVEVKAWTERARSWTDAAFLVEVTITSSTSWATKLRPSKEIVNGNNNKYLVIRNDITKTPLRF